MCVTSDKNPSCHHWESKSHAMSPALDQNTELSHTSLQLWTLPSQLTGHPSKNTFLSLLTGSVWKSQLVSYQKRYSECTTHVYSCYCDGHFQPYSFFHSFIHSFICMPPLTYRPLSWSWFLKNALRVFLQTLHKCPLWLIRILMSKVTESSQLMNVISQECYEENVVKFSTNLHFDLKHELIRYCSSNVVQRVLVPNCSFLGALPSS